MQSVQLPMGNTIRECTVLKRQLLALLECPEAVLIDVADVELIDTAALQLLFAFDRERAARGLGTVWQGDSAPFREAAAAVGLQVGNCATSASDSVPA